MKHKVGNIYQCKEDNPCGQDIIKCELKQIKEIISSVVYLNNSEYGFHIIYFEKYFNKVKEVK